MTLEESVKEASGHVDALIQSMVEAGTSTVEMNFADKVLRPAITGIIIAHATQTNVADVENAVIDTFTSTLIELVKRTHRSNVRTQKNADEVAIHIEQLLRQAASQLTQMVQDEFAPKVKLVQH
jgi:predicted SnoaL-like aldol condensation-catalyzing enzyme